MRRLIVGAVAVGLMVPAFSSALTIDQIQQQIAALLAQVAQLQQQIAQLPADRGTATPAVPSSTTSSSDIVCPVFNSTLSRGGRGDAVTALQKFLAERGLLTSDAMTGFYGTLTESAVRNFQSQQGLVSSGDAATTGWGAVGKLTSAAIVRVCSSQASTPAPGSKNPNACATVPVPSTSCDGTWTANMDSRSCVASWQCVPSQTSCTMQMLLCPTGQHVVASGCSQSCVNDAAYSCPAILRASCPVGQHYQYGTMRYDTNGCGVQDATCVADTNSSKDFTVSPSTGSAPLTVTFTSLYGDATRMSFVDGQDTTIDFGDGSAQQWVHCNTNGFSSVGVGICTTAAQVNHTYEKSGTYTATLGRTGGMCFGVCPITTLGTATITVGSNQCLISQISVDCAQGYHYTGTMYTTDSAGCSVPHAGKCLPNAGSSTLTGSISPTNQMRVTYFVDPIPDDYPNSTYFVDFGDGSRAKLVTTHPEGGQRLFADHTYQSKGTYTARFLKVVGATESYIGGDTNLYQTLDTMTIKVGTSGGSQCVYNGQTYAEGSVISVGSIVGKICRNGIFDWNGGDTF